MKYYTEEGVYAVLDEGCSSTAHGSDWVTNAATKLGLQLLRPYSFKNPHGLLGKSMPVANAGAGAVLLNTLRASVWLRFSGSPAALGCRGYEAATHVW